MKFLIGLVVVAVLAGVGYIVLTGNIPGQQPPPAQTPAEQIWLDYAADYERGAGNMPSPGTIGTMRDACIVGLPGTGVVGSENPGYGPTDGRGRATAAWVCIGSPMRVDEERCEWPTGTTRADYTGQWLRGHLVSFQLGGDGERRDSGGCQNIVPQTRAVNALIRSNPENYAKTHAGIFYIAIPHYRSDDSLPAVEAAKPDYLYYFAFSETGAPAAAWFYPNS
jgi:hypothetical protein